MKKSLYAVILLVLLVGSFLIGSWYNQRKTTKVNPSGVKSQDSSKSVTDVVTDTPTYTNTALMPSGTVKISPERQQAIGVKVGVVERRLVTHTLRILGRVAVDDTRQYIVNAATGGWVMDIAPVTPGVLVKKGDVLASFYAPELLGAQQSYLYGLNALDRLKERQDVTPAQIESTTISLTQYRDGLRNLGMGDKQIDEIARTRERAQRVDMCSPTTGIIIFRNIFLGLKFVQGTEFFRIADLSHLWILVDIFENEGKYLNPGVKARVKLSHQEISFKAVVSNVLPLFDAATRTLKFRLEADNPDYALRPDMFVDVELPITLPLGITVPVDAVLDSGLKKTVFVDLGNGFFEPREVETGWRLGNRVEIIKGLKPEEKIVISGNFLIDSESRMELAAAGMVGKLSKDPACGVDVSISKAEKTGMRSSYKGKTYYFSSDECKQQFDKNPQRYTKNHNVSVSEKKPN